MHKTPLVRALPLRRSLLSLLLLSPLVAQESAADAARMHVALSLASGTFEHRTADSDLDDRTRAALFRLAGEYVGSAGFGGGLRLESMVSDDDLFEGKAGANPVEASDGTVYVHGTYRFASGPLDLPVRLGVTIGDYRLTDQVTDRETDYQSAGVYFEAAPEWTVLANESLRWSVFAEAGVGIAATNIDPEGDARDYDATTARYGFEVGTRVTFGRYEVALSGIGRWQHMGESDDNGGFAIAGYDSEFVGISASFGVTF